jgi:hypothetical protein
MTSENTDPVADEIAQLRAEIAQRRDRIAELEKLRGHPHVIPVQVFWRYQHEYREDYDWSDEWNLLESAYKSLEYRADDGKCAPVGVEVGGVMFKQAELRERFGTIEY